ncbi:MAG: response regulator [Kiritimatiellia bacterium]
MKKIAILIADDHEVVRAGLAAIFRYQRDFIVAGEAKDGAEALARAQELRPDVVVMDLAMPGMDGVAATRAIRRAVPAAKIIILTTYASSSEVHLALEAGALGAVSKDAPTTTLVAAIRDVARGRQAFSPDIAGQIAAAERPVLTGRQLEILEALTRGLSNHDIAVMCHISEDGVKAHLKALFAKLNVANRLEASAYALKMHLVR